MEIVHFDMPYQDLDINLSGDKHKGAANCHHGLVEDLVHTLKGQRQFNVNHGDNMEAITPQDKRFEMACVDPNLSRAEWQMAELVSLFTPVRKRLINWNDGNHELKLANIINPGRMIAEKLGVPYGAYNTVIFCSYGGRLQFKIFASHGFGQLTSNAKDPIQRDGNMDASLKQKLVNTGIADCVVMSMGHTHQLRVVEPSVDREINLVTTKNKIKHRRREPGAQNSKLISPENRWFVNTGSFLRLYAPPGSGAIPYGEMRGFRPTDLGWAVVKVRGKKVVSVEKHVG